MSTADAVIAALRTGNDTLASFVSQLGDDDLARPSGASEWDISQVLSHLGSGAELTQITVRAALDGTPNPARDSSAAVWDRWNAMTRRDRAEAFLHVNDSLTRLYESLDASARENLRIDMGFLPAPVDVASAARLRLSELALHSWDVHVTFDEHATLAPEATEQLLHGSPDLIGWIGRAAVLDGEQAVIQVTTSEPASVFALLLHAQIEKTFDVPEKCDGTLTLPAEAWLRLVAGRLAPRHTPHGMRTTGATDIDLLRRVFPGY